MAERIEIKGGYCHDPEIIRAAKELGITDENVINEALSVGEAVVYDDGVEKAREYLDKVAKRRRGKGS